MTQPSHSPEVSQLAISEETRVRTFQETLGQIAEARVVDISLDLYQDDPVHDGVMSLTAEAYSAQPTFLVHPAQEALAQPDITFTPLRTRGGKRSVHGVFFGTMQWQDGNAMQVAVKPHDTDSRRSCATDYVANVAIDELGLHNLESLGVVMSARDETAYSITRLNPGLTTLDSVNWRYFKEDPNVARYSSTIWSQVARQTAMIHALGSVKHGDLAARNIAVQSDGGVFPIDWEHASISLKTPRDAEVRYSMSWTDMSMLMESLILPPVAPAGTKIGLGLFAGSHDVWGDFSATVFDEYAQTRLGYVQSDPAAFKEVEEELHELSRSLQAHIELIS